MKRQLLEDIDKPMEELIISDEECMQKINFDNNITRMLEIVERRENAAKNIPLCPYCNSVQVQLTQWFTPTLQYKCRTCSQKFVRTVE